MVLQMDRDRIYDWEEQDDSKANEKRTGHAAYDVYGRDVMRMQCILVRKTRDQKLRDESP